jgi:glycosidase
MVHVHITSPVYVQHPDWFWPAKLPDGSDCTCGPCDWNTQGHRCWFTNYLPHWNFTNADARDYSVGNVLQWIKDTNIDGLRLDAIKHVDNSWLLQLRQRVTSEIIAKQSPQQRFYMVGETYDFGNREFLRSFVDPKTKLDGQFDFPLRLNLLKAVVMRQSGYDMAALASFMDGNDTFYGPTAVMSTWIGNHDLGRVIHQAEDTPMWDEYSDGKDRSWVNQPQLPNYRAPYERLANAFAVLMTNKGAPLIYYGDEVGLAGAGDPDNRRVMQFGSLNADQQFLFDRMKVLGQARAAHPAMRRGTRTTVSVSANLWVYKLTTTGDTVYVAVNRADSAQNATGLPSGTMQELVTSTSVTGSTQPIPARQTRIFAVP